MRGACAQDTGAAEIRINSITSTLVTNVNGAIGTSGLRLDGVPTVGGALESAVISIAEHVACVDAVPAVGVQLTGEPSAVVPLMNCTVPVMPGPPSGAPVTFAVNVTLVPELTAVALVVSAVVVGTVPLAVTVMEAVPALPA